MFDYLWLEWANLAANLTSLLLIPVVGWLVRRTRGLTRAVASEDATTLAALGRIEARQIKIVKALSLLR